MTDKTELQKKLFDLQDPVYRAFIAKLLPTIPFDRVIGVRTPILRSFAKEFARTPDAQVFLNSLPHFYYEENNLHAFLIERIKDYESAVAAVDRFLPFVDNWATCDSMAPRVFANRPELLLPIQKWIGAEHPYTVRYAIGTLMRWFSDEAFTPACPDMVAAVQSEEYYVRMMIAWYFATALAKQYNAVLPYLTEHRLPAWTHNKTIQKAIESYRITPAQKTYLKTLKRPLQ